MQTKFYYKLEPFRGYIPNDKTRVNDEPYEQGGWNEVIGEEITKKYQAIRTEQGIKQAVQDVTAMINTKIDAFLADKKLNNPKIKPFYLNFNADGIDCFVHRWNINYSNQ